MRRLMRKRKKMWAKPKKYKAYKKRNSSVVGTKEVLVIFEAISELSLPMMNPDKPTLNFFGPFVFSVIKSLMWVGVLSW